MKIKNILIISLLSLLISSCSGNLKKDKSTDSQPETSYQEPISKEPQNFDAINSQKQAEELNQKTQETIEEVQVPDRVFFDLNQSSLSSEAEKILDTQTAWLKSDENIKITVEGHCDERGTREYNIALGEKRANAVKKYLTSHGIDSSRIKTMSYGKERPQFVGEGEEIWAKNRRSVTINQE